MLPRAAPHQPLAKRKHAEMKQEGRGGGGAPSFIPHERAREGGRRVMEARPERLAWGPVDEGGE